MREDAGSAAAALPVIGLVGGIGSGKSTVAGILAELGCLVSDSDAAGRAALRVPAIRSRLVERWGQRILNESGEVDRKAVAGIVFANPEERRFLESVTHPWIESRRTELFASATPQTRALVIDAPLLLEAGLDRICDAIVFVDASPEVRLRRVMETRNWSESNLAEREESQLPLDVKRSRADYVLENDGDLNQLTRQVRRILSEVTNSIP